MPITATPPAKQPRWATDGGADITEPTELKKDAGWIVEAPAHDFFNWLLNLIYLWVVYFKLATDQLDTTKFEKSGGTVTGATTFNAEVIYSLNSDGSSNGLKAAGVPKAWGVIHAHNGANGTVVTLEGWNVGAGGGAPSIDASGGAECVLINLVRAMGSVNYDVVVTSWNTGANPHPHFFGVRIIDASSFKVFTFDASGLVNVNTTEAKFSFTVMGKI